jgi:rfaE bifunctional protein nucleotidyltransferase chain/domain
MSDISRRIAKTIREAKLSPQETKSVLREAVKKAWPDMPPWTTLTDGPLIEEVQKATAGSGVVLTFVENGERKVVLAEAGDHYKKPGARPVPAYMIPGGFINLTRTEGSSLVPASGEPEDARTGAAREVEEEFRKADGSPLLSVDPGRLRPMDTKTIAFPNGERRIVMGLMLELTPDEAALVKAHVAKLEADPVYKSAVAQQSANKESKKPEVASVAILPLEQMAQGRCNLLHKDQQSLFKAVRDHFDLFNAKPRSAPTRAYQQKVKSLADLKSLVDARRAAGKVTVGVTSGAFDIVHPGHISFLEDASRQCDFLVAIIASDRTVKEQKGAEKPYITELKRAQTIAAIGTVDAVIISDEKYHETILRALRPEILFKGDDYKGVRIMGAELAGNVVLIPCAEKEFYSSSEFVKKIRNGNPPKPPLPGQG